MVSLILTAWLSDVDSLLQQYFWPPDHVANLAFHFHQFRLKSCKDTFCSGTCPILQKVDGESLFESQPKCKDFIIEALKFHLASGDANKLASFGNSARTKPRQPIGLPKVQ